MELGTSKTARRGTALSMGMDMGSSSWRYCKTKPPNPNRASVKELLASSQQRHLPEQRRNRRKWNHEGEGTGNLSGLTYRALRPGHREQSLWFWADFSLKGDCYAHVLVVTRRVTTGVRCAHYKYVFIVSHADRDASGKINTRVDFFSPRGDGRDLFQNLRRTLGRHEPSLLFLMNERLRRLY